ncbi:MAG: hypothetical protein H0V69_12600 [Acidimicrobiia bacterium]|nr:hypothetical protein [Acidimicrobiia bacterium]
MSEWHDFHRLTVQLDSADLPVAVTDDSLRQPTCVIGNTEHGTPRFIPQREQQVGFAAQKFGTKRVAPRRRAGQLDQRTRRRASREGTPFDSHPIGNRSEAIGDCFTLTVGAVLDEEPRDGVSERQCRRIKPQWRQDLIEET